MIRCTMLALLILASAGCGVDTNTLENSPELFVEAITTDPATPDDADSITVEILVTNRGQSFGDDFKVALRIFDSGDTLIFVEADNTVTGGLNEDSSTTVSVPVGTLVEDEYQIEVVVDSVDSIEEADESNNTASRTLSVASST